MLCNDGAAPMYMVGWRFHKTTMRALVAANACIVLVSLIPISASSHMAQDLELTITHLSGNTLANDMIDLMDLAVIRALLIEPTNTSTSSHVKDGRFEMLPWRMP